MPTSPKVRLQRGDAIARAPGHGQYAGVTGYQVCAGSLNGS
jgi:hypothetical protein